MAAQDDRQAQGPADPAEEPCKAFDCEFTGSEEFGGYCYKCFAEVTKHEANKQGKSLCKNVCLLYTSPSPRDS